MCGIIGYIGTKEASPLLLEGLKRLEYRGYDSSGIATIHQNNIHCTRSEGKLSALEELLKKESLTGTIGIGHTRWATHGVPSTRNAHPHIVEDVAVIHNGIIENFIELRERLSKEGYTFKTETDTEVIPHLIHHHLKETSSPLEAVFQAVDQLEGAFALGIIFADHPDHLIAARKGSPLAIGYGGQEMFIASDAYALAPLTSKLSYLHDGDIAYLTKESVTIYDEDKKEVEREATQSNLSTASVGKGDYRHFMQKEIHEQPLVIGEALNHLYNPVSQTINLPVLPFSFAEIEEITIIACGTSYFAAMVAKYWFEQLARIPVRIDIASEFRYRGSLFKKKNAALFISQSGETADTLAALRYAKEQEQYIISIVNAQESSIERESDVALHNYAGPEIGVASTKAYTTQLTVLASLAIAASVARGHSSKAQSAALFHALAEIPARALEVLAQENHIKDIAEHVSHAKDVLYIGRGTAYPTALEGALKLKEISYIHAEGIAAGELKHGPIALIDEDVPVIAIAPSDHLFEKTASNIQEVAARKGRIICITDSDGAARLEGITNHIIELPNIDHFASPILYTIPIQLLAYHVAVHKGTDIDQPRNLAKSVTVE